MRLAVDANVLVGELTRPRGRMLIAHDALDLLIAEKPWSEAPHELRKRLYAREQQGRLVPGTVEDVVIAALAVMAEHIRVIEAEAYSSFEEEARERIPRDP